MHCGPWWRGHIVNKLLLLLLLLVMLMVQELPMLLMK